MLSGRCPYCNKPLPHSQTQCIENLRKKTTELITEIKSIKGVNERLRGEITYYKKHLLEKDRILLNDRWKGIYIKEFMEFLQAEPVLPLDYPQQTWPETQFYFEPDYENNIFRVKVKE